MEIDTFDKGDRLIIDMKQNHGLANLIRKSVWENDGEAGYDKGHPLGDESNLVVKSDDPEEVLQDAVDTARDAFEDLQGAL
ncbi:MAG: RpoL/Rpb11 RNA polymerase subunit family protein [Candidatus Nanohaloarchaea archaeon]